MSTKLYLKTTTVNVAGLSASELSTAMAATGYSVPPTAAIRDLSTSAGTAAATITGTTADQTSSEQLGYFGKWISPALVGGDITAQTWTIAMNGSEANAAANQFFAHSLYVETSTGTVRGYVYDSAAHLDTELPTTRGGRVFTIDGSAVSGVLAADKLVFEVWCVGTESGAAGARVITVGYNGTVDPVDATNSTDPAAYISTPQNLFTVTTNGTASATSATSATSAGTKSAHLYTGTATATSATSASATGTRTVKATAAATSPTPANAAGTKTNHQYAGTATGASTTSATATGTKSNHLVSGTASAASASSASAVGTIPGATVVNGTATATSPTSAVAAGSIPRPPATITDYTYRHNRQGAHAKTTTGGYAYAHTGGRGTEYE